MPDIELDLADFKASWMLSDQAESTVDGYVTFLRKYHEWCDGDTPTMKTARRWLSDQSPWQRYMAIRALRAYGKWFATEYREANPYEDLKCPQPPKPKPQTTATAEDVATLIASIDDSDIEGLRDVALIHVLACTGMRRSEAARMEWRDLDLADGFITIPRTKNGTVRTARLTQEARRAVKRYLRALDHWEADQQRMECTWVWASLSSRKGGLTSNGIGQMIARRAKAAKVNVTAHAFRRGFAMRWLREGGSEVYLRRAAGWDDTRMVQRYVNAVADEEALREHEKIFG